MSKRTSQDHPQKETRPWESWMKNIFSVAPQDMVAWLSQGTAEFGGLANTELEGTRILSDMLCYVTVKGKEAMLHVEFHKQRDASMAERLWEYNVYATLEHHRPVRSCVIYLTKDSTVEGSYSWVYPENRLIHQFQFEVLKLWEIPTEGLLQTGLPGVLPLLPMTREGKQREMVDQAIDGLMPLGGEPRRELLSLLYGFASLVLESRDQDWLHGRFAMLDEILRDSPAYQEIAKRGRLEGIEQGRAEGRAEGEREGELKALRHVATTLVATRFASAALTELVHQTLDAMDDLPQFRRLIANLMTVQTPDEARQVLTDPT